MILNKISNLIQLRSIEKTDLPLIKNWRNSPKIQPFVREYRELSSIHVENWYNTMILDKQFEFFIIENISNSPIGITGLTYINTINKHADLHLGLYEVPWSDEKYGNEIIKLVLNYGFNYINLNKIYAEIYDNDTNKLKLFKNNGFKTDGILREHYYFEGKYINSHILSHLKSEYENYK